MKVAYYGGTFDPIHDGHVHLVRAAVDQLGFDRVIVMPAGNPYHKDTRLVTQASFRYYMCQLALEKIPEVELSSRELVQYGPSYTLETIRAVRGTLGPGDELWLLCGSDVLYQIHLWHQADTLLKEVSLVVAARPGEDRTAMQERADELSRRHGTRISLFKDQMLDVSSSEIREQIRAGDESVSVDPAVMRFIRRQGLYREGNPTLAVTEETADFLARFEAELFGKLPLKRMVHTIGVMRTAIRLALRHGISPDRAAVAGLCHDMAKAMSLADMRQAAVRTPEGYDEAGSLLHGPAAAGILRDQYGVDDEDVLNAVCYHTTLRPGASGLEKILYLADKLEPGRDFNGIDQLRQIAENDINQACLACLDHTEAYLNSQNVRMHPFSLAARRELQELIHERTNIKLTSRSENQTAGESATLAERIHAILEDKKARDIEVLPVAERSSLADYFIIASGTSRTHVRSLSGDIQALVSEHCQIEPRHVEGDDTAHWILLDYGDVVVHLFQQEDRSYYNLDKLWARRDEAAPADGEEETAD